jgi:SPP1 family predicted phage head-tail adaptor
MNAGLLDTRLTIQEMVSAPNDSGDVIETPSSQPPVWASKKFLKGRELIEAKAIYDEVEVLFTIRYSTEVSGTTSKHQLLSQGDYFDIMGDPLPVPGGRPTKLLIYAKRKKDGSA